MKEEEFDNAVGDPLDELFADRKVLDTATIADLLRGYVQLYTDPPEVVLTQRSEKLSQTKKVLIFMLGRKALRIKGLITEDEERLTPAQLAEYTRINPNSMRPTLSRLRDERAVKTHKEDGSYWIPDNALFKVKAILEGSGGEE